MVDHPPIPPNSKLFVKNKYGVYSFVLKKLGLFLRLDLTKAAYCPEMKVLRRLAANEARSSWVDLACEKPLHSVSQAEACENADLWRLWGEFKNE